MGCEKLNDCRNVCQEWLRRFQRKVFGDLGTFFFKYGFYCAKYPWAYIAASVVLCVICSAGLVNFYEETELLNLWLPADSEYKQHYEWIAPTRTSVILVYTKQEDGNIFEADNIKEIYELRKKIGQIKTNANSTWESVCLRRQVVLGTRGGDNNEDSPLSWPDGICADLANSVSGVRTSCMENHFLELWADIGDNSFNSVSDEIINNLTTQGILDAINSNYSISGLSGQILSVDILESGLGMVIKDPLTGKLQKARAMTMYFVEGNSNTTDEEGNLQFEKALIDLVNNFKSKNLTALPFTMRSLGDVTSNSVQSHLSLLLAGYVLVLIYGLVMLGKFNFVQHRAYMAMTGMCCILMGVGSCYGLCSTLGLIFTPTHSILPFMLLGIGIDDMFIIVQSYDSIIKQELSRGKGHHEKMGLAMQHAGVAITITSVTDLMAFCVGASTVIPALRSFCLYAACGILFVFLFMVTFFFSWFCQDTLRANALRDSCCCCWVHDNWAPNNCSQRETLSMVFNKFASYLVQLPIKIAVICVTLVFAGFAIHGLTKLETDFDFTWYIEDGTYLSEYFEKTEELLSNRGLSGNVYFIEVNPYHSHMDDVEAVAESLRTSLELTGTSGKIGFHASFRDYINFHKDEDTYPDVDLTEHDFQSYLAEFLYTKGRDFQQSVTFQEDLTCKAQAPKLKSFTIPYTHRSHKTTAEFINGIKEVERIVKVHAPKFGAEAKIFAFSPQYTNYMTVEIITIELFRNVMLALLCVFLSTLFLITNLFTSILVCVSVLFTLLNLGGFMHFWGLTIDTSAAILITISMGLTVDYSAHIGYAFMVAGGSKKERVVTTLTNMGPPVLNGGFSTFLAVGLLISSKSYVFIIFFKIFFLIVVFGLFHGLVFLPVILSMIGPNTIAHDEVIPASSRPSSVWQSKKKKPKTPKAWSKATNRVTTIT